MRKILSVLLVLCLAVGMLCIPTVAATQDYTLDASSGAVATASGFVGTVTRNGDGTYTATYTSSALKNGGFYVLLSVSASLENGAYEYDAISEDSIQYIDQTIAEAEASNGKVSFANFIPKSLGKDQVLLLGGVFNGVDSPVALGAILKQGVEISGYVSTYNPQNPTKIEFFPAGTYNTYKNNLANLPAADAEGEIAATTGTGLKTQAFTVEGVGEGTYDVRISKSAHVNYWITGYVVGGSAAAMNTQGNSYVVPCGDIDGNGTVNAMDLGLLTANATYNKAAASAYAPLADLDGNGTVQAVDLGILTNSANYNKNAVVVAK